MEKRNTIMKKNMSKLDRLCLVFTKHRIILMGAVLLVTAFFLFGAFKIHSETNIWEMLPYDHPYLKLHARFSQIFGSGGSAAIIAVEAKKGDIFTPRTLTKIKKINDEIELWDEVYRLLTVSIASNASKVVKTKARGEISVEALMFPRIPQNKEEMSALKKNIFSNPFYNGTFVSQDGRATLILTEFKENVSYARCFELLQKIRKTYTDDETAVHIVGFPMLMGWIYDLRPQMYYAFAVSVIAIVLVLLLIFRNFQGMFSPVVNAGILTIWGLGFIGYTGVNFSPMLYVLAFLVGARMIGNSHQIAYRYFEELDASGGDRFTACYETMRTMWIPNSYAVATDAAGFAVLFLAKIVLMKNLSIIMTFWMATILMTGFLVPVVCSLFPFRVNTSEWKKETCQLDRLAAFLMKITRFSIGPRTRYLTGGIIILVAFFCLYEMGKLKIGDPTSGSNIFYERHTFNRDTAFINTAFNASADNLTLYFEGPPESVYQPAVLKTFEAFDRHMAESLPDIYKSSSSIIDMGKTVQLMLYDGDQIRRQLPRNPEQFPAVLGYTRNSAGTATLSRFVDYAMSMAQINIFFADHTSDNLLRIRDAAYAFFKDHPRKIEPGEFKLAGGRVGMEIAVNEEMKRSHILIDLAVYCGIFLLCTLCYKSFVAGLMLTLPLVLSNSICAAYLSLRNIGLSINTLPVAAIGAGLGVDFAIYLYSRAQEEFFQQKGDWTATIMQCICTCGKAVVYTGVTVILPILTWYFVSDMKFQAEVGFFLSLIMAINVILCFTLHPLMISIVKPNFISERRPALTATGTVLDAGKGALVETEV